MEDIRTVEALRESVARMETLLEAKPRAVACDLHPKYNTVAVAESLGLPVMKIQHHYAHVVSCMAENDEPGPVIGVSFDGTGYGSDGTVWGGEFLKASYSGFERLGSIRPFLQSGGEASAREGWRVAVSMLYGIYRGKTAEIVSSLGLCGERDLRAQLWMADRKVNSVVSTSAGRLFDGVGAILGFKKASTFEGEAAMALQFAAEAFAERHPDGTGLFKTEESPLAPAGAGFVLRTDALVRRLTEAALSGVARDRLAWEFHAALADLISAGCEKARETTGLKTCALSGGVFQNRLLTGMCASLLRKRGFRVLLHSLIPPNDGGLALGQAVAAMSRLNQENNTFSE